MEKNKMTLEEATLKTLYDQLDDSKDVDDVEGLVDNILVVTDPKVNTEEYEEVIERAQEIVEDTPEGEIPFDEEWEGQYLQTCPICGATFVTDEILEPGAICPVCTQVPEAFVMVGRVETDEQVAKENNIDIENEEEDEEQPFVPETFEDETEEPEEEEKVEASEEVKSADNKLQENKESFPDTFINSVKKGGYKPLKYCREAGDNSFEEKMSAKELMDIYNNLNNIYSNLYSKNMTDKADEEELFNDIQYWEDRLNKLHENKKSDIKDIMEIVNEGKEVIEEATTKDLQDYVPEAIKNTNSAKEALETLNKLTSEELIRYAAILSIKFVYNSNDADLGEIEDFIRDYMSPEAIYKFAKDQIEEDLESENLSQRFNSVNESVKLQEESKADYDDLKALRTASDALQDLWDAIEGGESDYLGQFKSDIAEASDTIDNILKKAELANMETADILDSEIDTLADELDEAKKEESIDDEVASFEKQLEEVGITTTNKLYFVTGTPEDCHTLEEADEYYEILPKWDSKNYCRDRGDITEEQFELIDKNRDLAKEILKRAADNVNSYGPLD